MTPSDSAIDHRQPPPTQLAVPKQIYDTSRGWSSDLPGDYSSASDLFAYKWNCTGGAVQVRRAPSSNAFDVKFVGNAAAVAIANGYGDPLGGSVVRQPDGAFRVLMSGQIDSPEANSYGQKQAQFVVVAF